MPLAREIFQEGIRIPPILIRRRGKIDRALLDLLLANVRTPVEREGDLMAQLAAIHRGETRLRELVAKQGESRVVRNMREIQDYSARMMQAAIRKLPRGVYRFEDCLDNDGITDEPVWIRVAVTIANGRAVVDFTGSAPQVQGSVNANFAVTLAATMYVFRCLIEDDVPFTAGILRPIRVIAPEGYSGQRAASRRDGRGQCRNVATHHRCFAGRAGESCSGPHSGGEQRDHE